MIDSASHPTRAIVHLDRLAHNVALLRERAAGRPLWPAIKANAYGHGMEPVARALVALGCPKLCVAHVGEAAALRRAGIDADLLVLSAPVFEDAGACVEQRVEPVVCSASFAHALSDAAVAAGQEIAVHVKVDTGMGRVGVAPKALPRLLALCDSLPRVRIAGVMSHLPRADEADPGFTAAQIAAFARLREEVDPAGERTFHLANSAAVLGHPEALFDAVRPGIALYGIRPSEEMGADGVDVLQPVLEWKTRISFLKDVPAGTGLSYGHDYTTPAAARIATIPVGYGDGLPRAAARGAHVLVGGQRCPLVGRVTMDQCLTDVTALGASVDEGDEVVLIGRQGGDELRAETLAAAIGTIGYEVVTAISARVPRDYAQG